MVSEVDHHKHLGLTFSNNGHWGHHIADISSRARTRLNLLRGFKYILDRKSLLILYFSFIRPILEYACCIWDNCSVTHSVELEEIQLEAARLISGAVRGTSHSLLYNEVELVPLRTRRKRYKLIQMYKMLNGLTPHYLTTMLPPTVGQLTSNYALRNSHHISTCYSRTSLFHNSFIISSVNLWNELPDSIKNASSLRLFKHRIDHTDEFKPTIPLSFYYIGTRVVKSILLG